MYTRTLGEQSYNTEHNDSSEHEATDAQFQLADMYCILTVNM